MNKLSIAAYKSGSQAPISVSWLEPAFQIMQIPGGIGMRRTDGRLYGLVQLTDQSTQHIYRMALLQAAKDMQTMRSMIRSTPTYKAMVTKDLRSAIDCLVKTQSKNLAESIPACMMMDEIHIQAPIMKELNPVIDELKKIYFHYDGSICFKGLMEKTKAGTIITNFVDKTHKQLDHRIGYHELINPSTYQQLKMNTAKNNTGWSCSQKKRCSHAAQRLNRDMLSLVEACKKYDFKTAQAIQQRYAQYGILKHLINQYKQAHHKTLQEAHNEIYDNHGIVRAVQNDPAYLANKHAFNHATDAEKRTLNQNLLVRHHLKTKMHQQWNIAQSAPRAVHDAMYRILGDDCSALADIALLQERIELVIKEAPKHDYDKLVKAFYEPNGVLKEYALHLAEAKNTTMPERILSSTYTTERQQLNTLLCIQIKNPAQAAQAQEASSHLEHLLSATSSKEQIDAKAAFNNAYEAVVKQEEETKHSVQLEAQKIVDAKSSMPMPPKPEFEPEKNDRRKKSIVIKVNNMKEFFELDFGKSIQKKVAPTNYRYQGQAIYRVTEKIPNSTLKKGDYFYLDALHRDHFEVFNKNGVIKNGNYQGTLVINQV